MIELAPGLYRRPAMYQLLILGRDGKPHSRWRAAAPSCQ